MAIRRPKQPPKPTMEAILWKMHSDLLARCQQMLASGEPLKADAMNVIRAFLKDNSITVDAEHEQDVRAGLTRLSDLGVPFKL